MKSENALQEEAMDILVKKLGLIDAERFIVSIKQNNFDYTIWRKNNLWKGMTLEEVYQMAVEFEKKKNKSKTKKAKPSNVVVTT